VPQLGSLFFLALDFLFVHCSTRVFSFPMPHANRPLKMPIATTATQKHHYDSMMNLLCSEVKTIFALKFDS
jgi:hypothetical protein